MTVVQAQNHCILPVEKSMCLHAIGHYQQVVTLTSSPNCSNKPVTCVVLKENMMLVKLLLTNLLAIGSWAYPSPLNRTPDVT